MVHEDALCFVRVRGVAWAWVLVTQGNN